MWGQHFDFDLDIVKGIYIPVLNFGFDLDWEIVTSLCYTIVKIWSLSVQWKLGKVRGRVAGWVGGWWLAGWVLNFRDRLN